MNYTNDVMRTNPPREAPPPWSTDNWNLADSWSQQLTAIPRIFAAEYTLNGWRVDATTQTHLKWRTESSVKGFAGPVGAFLILEPVAPIVPEPHDKAVWIRGVNSCPRCTRPLRFVTNCVHNGPEQYTERCPRCAINVQLTFTSSRRGYGFFVMARTDRTCSPGFGHPGPWYLISTRIDSVLCLPHESEYFNGYLGSKEFYRYAQARVFHELNACDLAEIAIIEEIDRNRQRQAEMIQLRGLAKVCVLCGKPLPWHYRFRGKSVHPGCSEFKED